MQSVCAAVVALGLICVCCSAPLTCDTLNKPPTTLPQVSGRWYILGVSSYLCLPWTLFNAVLGPSLVVDLVATDMADIYNVTMTMKSYGFCYTGSVFMSINSNREISEVDKNNVPVGMSMQMFQWGCADCLVLDGNDTVHSTRLLFSRRGNLSVAELEELELQFKCLCWDKLQFFHNDHDYENCLSLDSYEDQEEAEKLGKDIVSRITERMESMRDDFMKCIFKSVRDFICSYVFGQLV